MTGAIVWILDREPMDAGPLGRLLQRARTANAVWLAEEFRLAGARDVRVEATPDDTSFGARARALAAEANNGTGGIVLGAGSLPLARPADLQTLVATASSGKRIALTNSRYSADVTAIGRADILTGLPDLPADNALPRWLAEIAGVEVRQLPGRGRLAFDLDSPLDVALLARSACAPQLAPIGADELLVEAQVRLDAVAAAGLGRRNEVLVAGRTSATALRWLERASPARVRALVEERGLRAGSRQAQADGPVRIRPPASVLGMVLDRDGPDAFAGIVERLADAALVDSRVLLAHRLGPDERGWPDAEDRFASDLLLDESIADPWLRALTRSARTASIPIVLGGHTLVGPGIPFVFGPTASRHGARRG